MKESQKDCIKNDRNNPNYLYIKEILKSVNSKSLKISAINYLLLNRQQAYYMAINFKGNKNKEYLEQIDFLDKNFSFEDMFFIDIHFNPKIDLSTQEKDLKPIVSLHKKEINEKETYIQLSKVMKKKGIRAYNSKILNLFEAPIGNMLLELDLNKPLEELQEILKLAKKFFDKQKKQLKNDPLYDFLFTNYNILDEKLFYSLFNKRDANIPFDEKLIDLLYLIDCLILELKTKDIKKSFENYYITLAYTNKNLFISYIMNDYYKKLSKEAKNILAKIKEGAITSLLMPPE
jgi:hypothetical protein